MVTVSVFGGGVRGILQESNAQYVDVEMYAVARVG